jgi:hypothetical protein
MAIDMPSNRPPRSGTRISDHVRCEDFVFRIADVDGFSDQPVPEGEPVTVVNVKGYTQVVTALRLSSRKPFFSLNIISEFERACAKKWPDV